MAGQVGHGVIEVEDFAYGHEFQGFPSGGGIFARMVVVVPFDVGGKSHPVIYVCKRPDIGKFTFLGKFTTGGKVKATLTGRVLNEDYARILGSYPQLSMGDIIILDRVQKHLPVSAEDCKRLKGLGLIEGRRPNIYLSYKAAEASGNEKQKTQYIKNKSFDDAHFRELILSYLQTYRVASKSAITELLKDKMSDTLNEEQKIKKISNLLQSLRRSGKIVSAGYSLWKLP